NAVEAMRKMGYKMPRVAALAAIEKVNPKMRATVEAAELKRMNREGLIQHCIVEGPLSYDVAMDKAIAHHKGVDCEYCGDFDALILPDIDAGNILGKCLIVTAKAEMGGVIMGAKVPIVLTSRGSSAEEKFFSIAVASLMAGQTL
ncbi:MAG: phosphate butyryltransferase, partial [Clostridium sp.]|nr:phosphate butyryltransferase [Clostridium sp.]